MASEKTPVKKVLVVKSYTKRDVVVAASIGVLVFGALVWAAVSVTKNASGNWLTGTIIAKHFTPQPPEQQFTIGKGGLSERQIEGEYTFEVRVESPEKIYTVVVDKRDFDARKEGERFRFLLPPAEPR